MVSERNIFSECLREHAYVALEVQSDLVYLVDGLAPNAKAVRCANKVGGGI